MVERGDEGAKVSEGIKLTVLQAYKAMFEFIKDYYYQIGKPDQIGNLLSDMQLIKGEFSADPAAWNDWLEAVKKVQQEENDRPG